MKEKTRPNIVEAISMIVVLLVMIVLSVKANISIIPAMVIAVVWAMVIAMKCGYSYSEIMKPVWEREKGVIEIFLIILSIGTFVSTMMFSGTIPTVIYYLIKIVSPSLVVVLSFVLCAIVSIIIGTSWGTAGTVGVIMISIAQSMGVPMAIVAAAVASGSHVGQLMSPMADTASVSASFAETDTMTMIKRMFHYTIPVCIIATILYTIFGFMHAPAGGSLEAVDLIRSEIESVFNVNPLVILPMVFVFIMTFKKKPILVTLALTSLMGIVFGMIFNGYSLSSGLACYYDGFSLTATAGISSEGFSDIFLNLVNRGGAISMISAALIVIVATVYGTILMETKTIDVIAETLFKNVKSRVGLCISSQIVSILIVALTSSSFLASMMPRDLFLGKTKEAGYDGMDLISCCAPTSTQFLTCIPWCDTAVFITAISGVSTLSALPYNFFAWGCALVAIIFSVVGFGWKGNKRLFGLDTK